MMDEKVLRRLLQLETKVARLAASIETPKPTYAAILTSDGSTAQTGLTPTPVVLQNWETNKISSNMTADYNNNRLVATDAGTYLILFQIGFTGSVSTTFEFHLFFSGSIEDEGTHRQMGGTSAIGSCSLMAVRTLTANTPIYIYVETDGINKSLTALDMQLAAVKIGP